MFSQDALSGPEDVLKLVFLHVNQDAHMTREFNWIVDGDGIVFYDVWILRSLVGNTFYKVPPDVQGPTVDISSGMIRVVDGGSRRFGPQARELFENFHCCLLACYH